MCKGAYFHGFSVDFCCGSLAWRLYQIIFKLLIYRTLSAIDMGRRVTALGTCPVQANNTNRCSETSEATYPK
jgi:hypothetical protein